MKSKRKKALSVFLAFLAGCLFSVMADRVAFAEPGEGGGDGGPANEFREWEDKTPVKEGAKRAKTWIHPEKLNEQECGIQIYVRPEDIGLGTYTVYFKGALEGDMIVVSDIGNCHVGDSRVIEFDDERRAIATVLPKRENSKNLFFSGVFKTRAETIPFFIAWGTHAKKTRFITGKEGLPDSW